MIRDREPVRTVRAMADPIPTQSLVAEPGVAEDPQLHMVRRGDGEPMLLVHPLGAELVTWEPVMDRLATEHDVIAVDMPGFGSSPPLANGTDPTPQALATALATHLDGLGIGRAHLVGNSLGGWVALELAKAGRALSVTGLCSAGFWPRPLGPRPSKARTAGRAVLPLLPLLTRSARGRGLLLAGSVGHPERVPPAAAARLVRAYMSAPGFEGANAAMRATVFSGLERITAPVTLAWGELDRLVGEPRAGVPGTRRVLLPGCGHIPTWDDPELVSQVVLDAAKRST
jgi:pimeloyl-ACP methyl ester carboxylesterase